MNFSLAITHTPWIPERVESFNRLTTWLELECGPGSAWGCLHSGGVDSVAVFKEREPNWSWSEKMWTWAASTGASHHLFLQDDVIPMPGFWDAIQALVAANPDVIIGLETSHPAAAALKDEGASWCTTRDGLIGVGYVMPDDILKAFLAWRAEELEPGAIQAVSEDSLIGLYAAAHGLKIWHPIPTIIDHDTSIRSTYGNDAHVNRRPSVKWDEPVDNIDAEVMWIVSRTVPHLGRYYTATLGLLERWVRPSRAKSLMLPSIKKDTGAAELRRIWYAKRGRMPADASVKKIFVAIPNRGTIHPETALTIWKLRGEEFLTEWDIVDVRQESADICRIRARMVRHFLHETDADYLLFLDSDVACGPEAIRGMLAASRDFVAAPYPRRDMIDFGMLRKHAATDTSSAALAYRYSAQLPPQLELDQDGCGEARAMPLGCALLSRPLLAKMWDKYYDKLLFQDEVTPGKYIPTVGLFNLVINPETGGLLSEDYSFCYRVRESNEGIFIYLGLGSPASHHGSWSYHGDIESFGYKREKA